MKSTFSKLSLVLLLIAVLHGSCRKKDSDPEPITLECQTISSDRVLSDVVSTPGFVDYIVPCDISVEANLTIEPGVIIQFAANTGFNVNGGGSINATGTSSLPIVFRGATDAAGFWKGIYFNSPSPNNKLTHATVTGGGSNSFNGNDIRANIRVHQTARLAISYTSVNKSGRDGLYTEGTASNELNPLSLFDNNSFSDNLAYPLNLSAPASEVLDENSIFTNNGVNKIQLRGGSIMSAIKWRKTQVPLLVTGDVVISPYASTGTLYIEPGSIIHFASDASLAVGEYGNGSLRIMGTSTDRITITGETAVAGSWQGICFQSTNPSNEITNTDISYGGCCAFSGNTNHIGNVVVGAYSAGYVKISNTSINFSSHCGIKVNSGSTINDLGGNSYNGNATGNLCN